MTNSLVSFSFNWVNCLARPRPALPSLTCNMSKYQSDSQSDILNPTTAHVSNVPNPLSPAVIANHSTPQSVLDGSSNSPLATSSVNHMNTRKIDEAGLENGTSATPECLSTNEVKDDQDSADSPFTSSPPIVPMPNPLIEDNSSQPYENVLDCVLKVFCTHCEPNYALPWSMTPQRTSTSSAFIIRDRQILTNAHSVEHYTTVKVKRRDSDTKYIARVVAIGNECDIALLKVDDDAFWEQIEDDAADHKPYLSPGPLPHLQDSVLVIGYPIPGNQISVTAGVSSRVEMQQYVHGQGELLTVQIDAAINPGNSGGPVINDQHQVVGIAFQSIDPSQADSVGYFIPFCIVQHFLDDISSHDKYTGFPCAGFRWQRMENRFLRIAKKLLPSQSGVLVKWVAETSDASRVLKRGDIVTHIDGVSVSNAGTVPFRSGERIGLEFLVTSKFCQDETKVTILRDGVETTVTYKLSSMEDHRLVSVHDARHLVRRQPEYIVFGGLVFQTLSEPFLRTVYGHNWLMDAPVRLIDEYYRGTRTKEGRKEIVILAQILATETTNGYEQEDGNEMAILKTVNGLIVNSLSHLGTIIDQCPETTRTLSFELEGDAIIMLDKDAADEEEESILSTHCIPAARSLCADNT